MSPVPKVRLAGGLEICRLLNGMWQVSGSHGAVDHAKAGKQYRGNIANELKTGRFGNSKNDLAWNRKRVLYLFRCTLREIQSSDKDFM